jgi:hypothetical protein
MLLVATLGALTAACSVRESRLASSCGAGCPRRASSIARGERVISGGGVGGGERMPKTARRRRAQRSNGGCGARVRVLRLRRHHPRALRSPPHRAERPLLRVGTCEIHPLIAQPLCPQAAVIFISTFFPLSTAGSAHLRVREPRRAAGVVFRPLTPRAAPAGRLLHGISGLRTQGCRWPRVSNLAARGRTQLVPCA